MSLLHAVFRLRTRGTELTIFIVDPNIFFMYISQVMSDRLPQYVDPVSFAEQRRELSGAIPLQDFPRLSQVLENNAGDVQASFLFQKKGRLATIEGKIRACLPLVCQTCLQGLTWPIETDYRLAVVRSIDEADRLSQEYEPLLLQAEKILLVEIVEDEILLLLPDFPKHEEECFNLKDVQKNLSTGSIHEQENSKSPFSVLAKLKNTGEQ